MFKLYTLKQYDIVFSFEDSVFIQPLKSINEDFSLLIKIFLPQNYIMHLKGNKTYTALIALFLATAGSSFQEKSPNNHLYSTHSVTVDGYG